MSTNIYMRRHLCGCATSLYSSVLKGSLVASIRVFSPDNVLQLIQALHLGSSASTSLPSLSYPPGPQEPMHLGPRLPQKFATVATEGTPTISPLPDAPSLSAQIATLVTNSFMSSPGLSRRFPSVTDSPIRTQVFSLHGAFPTFGPLTQVPMESSQSPTQAEALIMSQLVRSRTPTPPTGNPQTPRPISPVVPKTPIASTSAPPATSKLRFSSPLVTPKQKRKVIPKTPYPDDIDVDEEDNSEEEAASPTKGVSFEIPVQAEISVLKTFSSAYIVEEQATSQDGEGSGDEEMAPNIALI
jgi:hypothetical protein